MYFVQVDWHKHILLADKLYLMQIFLRLESVWIYLHLPPNLLQPPRHDLLPLRVMQQRLLVRELQP